MSPRNVEDIYPLSPMQQGMLFHSLIAPDLGVYFEQTDCLLKGNLDQAAFRRAWEAVVARHPILRTSFLWEELEEPLQVVYSQVELALEQQDWRAFSPATQGERLRSFLASDRERGFDLASPPLMRLALLRTEENAYRFVWSHHHVLLDGWSIPSLLKEVFTFYEAFSRGQALTLQPTRPYKDYIAWLERQDQAKAENYWRETLQGFTIPTPLVVERLPQSLPAGEVRTQYGEIEISLPLETTQDLQALARQHQVTLNTLVQAAWAILLHRYSGEEEVLFGATVSGRPADLPGSEAMIGLFINTLPIRVRISQQQSCLDFLKALQARQAELRQYEYSPLVRIQEWSDLPRGQSMFESILVYENYPVDASLREQRGSLEISDVHSVEQTNYPITLVAGSGDRLALKIAYDGKRFDPETIRRMLGHLETLLGGMAAAPGQPVADLPLLTPAEERQILHEWNHTDAPYPADKCVHQLFEAQAERTPEAPAVIFREEQLTYRELNQRANRLAHFLRSQGVQPESLVAICVERSFEMVVAALGVLKAGGAYLPLDPSYPTGRLENMLSDSGARFLLTQAALEGALPAAGLQVTCLDRDWEQISHESPANPPGLTGPQDLAYAIYTSGSTGKPKGTLLQHQGLCNFTHAFAKDMRLSNHSRLLQFASFSFDASVCEIFSALLAGAALVMAPHETLLSTPDLVELLKEERVSVLILPPTMLRLLPPAELPGIQTVVSAGEACTPEIVARWAPGRQFVNGYGPTESTIGATWGPAGQADVLTIGRPFDNMQVYLLDERLRPVPVGVPGELHIGGAGLARGYLNRPELTAEKFIPNPFQPGSRLYKSGDLARSLPDGRIEFLGRIDQQVKLRGFRIELGEIEALLRRHPGVGETVVVARADPPGGQRLVAYVAPAGESAPEEGELRALLKGSLPDYMLPSAFVFLQKIPLTPSGKVDRKALPAPDLAHLVAEDGYVEPRSPVEKGLAEIWSQILGLPRVGLADNFFDLGGHSLLATQLTSRVREVFRVELPLRTLFEAPLLSQYAQQVELALREASGLQIPPITPAPDHHEALPLSFSQQRLWFLDQLEPGNLFYNIPMAVRLRGKLDLSVLERSLSEVVRRQASLRTTFAEKDGQPVQVIAPQAYVPLPVTDLLGLEESQREERVGQLAQAEARRPFDLHQGPLLRAQVLRLAPQEHVVLLTMHHIVSDGWSTGVLIRELGQLYNAFSSNRPSPLPDLPIQYIDYAQWQRAWLGGQELERQLAYWKEKLGAHPVMLELPTDRPRPAVKSSRGATLGFTLSKDLSDAIKALSREEGATLFMTLLAAFQTLLYRYTGQENISVGTAIANRHRAEVEDLIGFFVNMLVLQTDLSGGPGFRELLARVRETALGAYAHQDLPFEILVEALHPQRDLSHTPLFQVAFTMDTAVGASLKLPGLSLDLIETDNQTAKFDLTLLMSDTPTGLSGSFEYDADLFDEATIRRMAGHLETLLAGVVANPEQPIDSLPLLTAAEQQQLLVDWNRTEMPTPTGRCAHELFEARALQRPNAPAVLFEDQQLSYAELNARANQLAHFLLKQGVGPEVLVGILMDRSPEMVVAILGTLKAGGAYLPLDPRYPQERLAFMMEDAHIPLLLTQEFLAPVLPPHAARTIPIDAGWPEIGQESQENLASGVLPENLAYVIYTSGSTGKPKGAMLRHRGLSNLTEVQRRAFGIREGSRVLQFSPLSFDASVWETFMALANGAALVLARQEVLASGQDLVRLLREKQVTNVTLPPSVLRVLPVENLPALETVIAAGEACPADLVARWAPGRSFFNAYGPTETTVCASMFLCDEKKVEPPPIGRPVGNARLYVLDKHMQPVPVGIPGELHVGGVSLARGYLNRPELTAEKFVSDPFSGKPGARLYKTGDRVRYRPDGNLEFQGRVDNQVKIRGFRIELGEVENALERHPGVREAAVISREDTPGVPRLVAYLVAAAQPAPASGELRMFLRQTLPEYMLPAFFVFMEAMPMTPSAKVDRKALPAPDLSRPDLESAYVAPRNAVEEKLAAICKDLLGIEKVGVFDNFFELGGHSLLATQFISHVREALQVEIPLRAIFEGPTVAELALEVERAKAADRQPQAPAIQPISRAAHRVKRASLTAEEASRDREKVEG